VTFAGTLQNRRFDKTFQGNLKRKGDVGNLVVNLPVGPTLFGEIPEDTSQTSFTGTVSVDLKDGVGLIAEGTVSDAHLILQRKMTPSLEHFEVGQVFPNEVLEINSSGLLRPEEGTTWAIIESGEVNTPDGATRDLDGERIALKWLGARSEGGFHIDPAILGVQQADFHMTLSFENRLESGRTIPGEQSFYVEGALKQPRLIEMAPPKASRGQLIEMRGKGFVPNNDDQHYGMFFRFSGTFTPRNPNDSTAASVPFEGSSRAEIAPTDVMSHTSARQKIWYEVTDGRKLEGLGATPGVFDGTITPVLFDKWGQQEGETWDGAFEILPTRQVVYIKFLPAFTRGLEKYGLRNVEDAIRQRVLTVTNRDYSNYNVEFRQTKPRDFADYATIEVGGPDPTGTSHFGYDNSFNDVAKDTGNLYLADYLGGVNQKSAEKFNAPYGGIFIKSFSFFSKKLNPNNPNASKAFDRILKPFMPKLGGNPIRLHEWPEGPRQAEIEKAVDMVGNVIGNTVTHEIGHSLGMTYVPSDQVEPGPPFHNQNSGKYIMDAGSERPFEERAEIGDTKPPTFNSRNRQYLETILPKPK
jgi:hypothetical protein